MASVNTPSCIWSVVNVFNNSDGNHTLWSCDEYVQPHMAVVNTITPLESITSSLHHHYIIIHLPHMAVVNTITPLFGNQLTCSSTT